MSDLNAELDDARDKDLAARPLVLLLAAPVMASAAGGMGWGIRGQYGHEWGAMVPGVLVAFTLVFLFSRRSTSLHAARAVALAAVGFSFGGVMTYGQTVGLTHDHELVGNSDAYAWGMIGLFLKGGLWIGFGGLFLGIGLGGKKYRTKEMLTVYAAMLLLVFVGIQLLNRPYIPDVTSSARALPSIYFSDHWEWEPNNLTMKPRRECWGGLLAAFAGLIAYVWFVKKDKLARNLAGVGALAGGCGFTLGQSLQARHQWTPGWLNEFDLSLHNALPSLFPEQFFSLMGWNWWNMMETSFGLVMGFLLGLGFWFNRHLVAAGESDDKAEIAPTLDWILLAIYACMVALWGAVRLDEIKELEWLTVFTDFPFAMGLLPVVCILGGRYFPYMVSLPIIAVPIAGITLKVTDGEHMVTDTFVRLIAPLAVMTWVATSLERHGRRGQSGRTFTRWGLIASAFMYYSLNFAFFGFPWTVTQAGRHTNDWIFLRCAELLIFGALVLARRYREETVTKARTEFNPTVQTSD